LGQTASKVALNGTKKCPKTLAREQINLLRAGDRRLTALVQRSPKAAYFEVKVLCACALSQSTNSPITRLSACVLR
jgi:hypothetical protein